MKTIWLTGDKGQLAQKIIPMLEELKDQSTNNEVFELYTTDKAECDISNENEVEHFVNLYQPQLIINCAALSDYTICNEEPDEAYRVNTIGAGNLAIQAQRTNARLIHFSTDDVFNAQPEGVYNEFDTPMSNTVYGKSKLNGERLIQNFMTRFVILRSSWVYDQDYGYVSHILNEIKCGHEIFASTLEKAVPTSTKQIIDILKNILFSNHYGVFHTVATGGACSRYDLVKEIITLTGADLSKLHATSDAGSKIILDNMMMRLSHLAPLASWRDELKKNLLG